PHAVKAPAMSSAARWRTVRLATISGLLGRLRAFGGSIRGDAGRLDPGLIRRDGAAEPGDVGVDLDLTLGELVELDRELILAAAHAVAREPRGVAGRRDRELDDLVARERQLHAVVGVEVAGLPHARLGLDAATTLGVGDADPCVGDGLAPLVEHGHGHEDAIVVATRLRRATSEEEEGDEE